MALYLDIGPDDELRVGEDAVITIEYESGRRARLRIVGTAKVEMVPRTHARARPEPSLAPAPEAAHVEDR